MDTRTTRYDSPGTEGGCSEPGVGNGTLLRVAGSSSAAWDSRRLSCDIPLGLEEDGACLRVQQLERERTGDGRAWQVVDGIEEACRLKTRQHTAVEASKMAMSGTLPHCLHRAALAPGRDPGCESDRGRSWVGKNQAQLCRARSQAPQNLLHVLASAIEVRDGHGVHGRPRYPGSHAAHS